MNMDQTKIVPADLNSPCRELFIRGLGFVVTPLVRSEIVFLCASTQGAIQLYTGTINKHVRPYYVCPRQEHYRELSCLIHVRGVQY